jgi:hypothetical protein
MTNNKYHSLFFMFVALGVLLVVLEDLEEDDNQIDDTETIVADALRSLLLQAINQYNQLKRGRIDKNGAPVPKRRRSVSRYNWQRARQCIQEDFLGPVPIFNDRQFERTFRVTRAIVEEIYLVVSGADPFFRNYVCVVRQVPGICPFAKILMSLQMLAFGVSPSAIQHYYQMGETTARDAFKRFTRIIAGSENLRQRFFRSMTRSDATKISEMHFNHYGVHGMVGSLDCMHVPWKNCPVAWQGTHSGKAGSPTLVLEAMADHNMWFWHASFGWPGTLNDINIWNGSPLHEEFTSGRWGRSVDFPFSIGDYQFTKLFVLVDGIYPELSRFVKTFGEPISRREMAFSGWQEGARKDIERAFGCLQRKFHILIKPIEYWFKDDIEPIILCCIILHNWMVDHRMTVGKEEMADLYTGPDHAGVNNTNMPEDDILAMFRTRASVNQETAIRQLFYDGHGTDYLAEAQALRDRELPVRFQMVQTRWNALNDKSDYLRLRRAIMNVVAN